MIGSAVFVIGDYFSTVKRGVRYAHGGEIVKIVSISNPVAIVENSKGYRFPIGIKFLSFERPAIAAPAPAPAPSPVKRKAVKRIQAPTPLDNPSQQSLF